MARRLRGRSHPADAVIPALLLHLGHWENWLLGYQVAFTLPLLLTAVAVWLLADRPPTPALLTAGGGLALAVALCGGGGVLLAVPLAAAVGGAAIRNRAVAAAGLSLAVLAYAGYYVAARPPVPIPPPPVPFEAKLQTLAELLAGAAGLPARDLWPLSGWLAVAVAAAAALAAVALRQVNRSEAARLVWPACGAAGAAAIQPAIAHSRTGMLPHMGLSPRYALFTGFGFGCLPVIARPAPTGRLGRAAGPLVALLLVGGSVPEGLDYGHYFRHAFVAMRTRVRAGDDPDALTAEFVNKVYAGTDAPEHRADMRVGLEVMARHRIGPYRPAR